MNEIANIIAHLETQKAAIERALETLYDFETTGSITPAKSAGKAARGRKGGMTPEGRRRPPCRERAGSWPDRYRSRSGNW
jgi:hypothetical protein